MVSPQTQAQPKLEIRFSFRTERPVRMGHAGAGRSEPLLEGLSLSELVENSTHQDITFLAKELNKDTETLMRVAVSARLETAFKVPAPVFYAFLRQRIPAALPTPLLDASQNFTLIVPLIQSIASMIFALSPELQNKTLTAAIALDYVGPQFTVQIPELVKQLQALRSTDLLNQPYLVGNTTLRQLLEAASLPQAQQQAFATALASNAQSMRNFWRKLGNGKQALTAAEASTVERTLSVGAFVKNFVPLVQAVLQRFTAGTYTSFPILPGSHRRSG